MPSSHLPILPPAMLGILGGGQLGRFFVNAAHELGYRVTVLDPDKSSPAGHIADVHLCAGFEDEQALNTLSSTCCAISTEFENVPSATLERLSLSTIVRPSARCVGIAQHRTLEKDFLRQAGLPVAPYTVIKTSAELPKEISEPCLLKTARMGYDGKGQAEINSHPDALAAFERFACECVLEQKLPLEAEVSVVLARDATGHIASFPTVQNHHRKGILDISIAPSPLAHLDEHAQKLARQVAEKLDYVGVLGVEFFVVNGVLLVNEIAPRPHNSGHYTLDACVSNQFEQQVRVLTGLPLADTRLHTPAVMVNLLGDVWATGAEPDWQMLLAEPTLKLHLYGKQQAREGRKMGHYTVLHANPDEALRVALQVRTRLGV